ncbi:uncharacterized protein ALTATR162_LOCUS4952 [Alternaria atra]|uniref:Uncharacterized protein n=1 Tax=Alternaria atra TaxID=119953 RepID=A0A8J2I6T9_9PLEO|nr:uncharacterized protein ALTATR162_LOCUS4952 [Alternaria atra]CAG5157160.1 unnamed protein product [Alternaria atra]
MQAADTTEKTLGPSTTHPNAEDTQASGEVDPRLAQPKDSLENKSAHTATNDQAHADEPQNKTDAKQPDDEKNPTEVIASEEKDVDPDPEDESKYLSGFKLAILSSR